MSDILKNHEKRGKVFYPQFSNVTKVEYIDKVYPEVAWLGLLIELHGFEGAYRYVRILARAAAGCAPLHSPVSSFAFLSSFKQLTESDWVKILCELETEGCVEPLQQALAPFLRCYPLGNPLIPLCAFKSGLMMEHSSDDRDFVVKVLGRYSDKRSHPGVLLNALAVRIEMFQGCLTLPSDFPPPDFDGLVADVTLEKSSMTEGFIRANLSSSYMAAVKFFGFFSEEWSKYFWGRGLMLEAPSFDKSGQGGVGPAEELKAIDLDFRSLIDVEIAELTSHLLSVEAPKNVHWIVNGLIARQATLAVKIVSMPSAWTHDIGPVLLRSMIDCYVTLSWILKDPDARASTFIDYGLGQEKLHIEHLIAVSDRIIDPDQKACCLKEIRQRSVWVNSQQYLFLTSVNVGNWAGIDTRKMATDIGCEEIYNLEFRPKSAIAHNSWNAVARYNLRPASSALHLTVRLPVIDGCELDMSVPLHAACYFQSSVAEITNAFELQHFKVTNLNAWMQDAIRRLSPAD